MNEFFKASAAICALIAMLVSFPAWAASLYYLIRTARSTIHGDAAWKRPISILALFRWQPFSPVFDASQLTPQGLVYRRRLIISAFLFAVPILLSFLFRATVR